MPNTTQVTLDRFVLVLRDGSRFFLSQEQAERVKQSIKEGLDYLEVGESLISRYDFLRIVGSENYQETEKIKKGEWKCQSCGRWHSKFEDCGCQGGRF